MLCTSLTGTLSFSLLLVGQIFLCKMIAVANLGVFTSCITPFLKQQHNPKVFCQQKHKRNKANHLCFSYEISNWNCKNAFSNVFNSLILTFEPTLPPTDALISLGSCWSLLFSLYLDMKISLVHGFQIYRMSGNTRTICPVVLYPLHSHNVLQSALAWVSTRSQVEEGALAHVCHPEKAGSHSHLFNVNLLV